MSNIDMKSEEMINCGLSVQERDLLQSELRELEDTTPPRAVWNRIEEQARAESLFQAHWSERNKWLAGAGLAAAVVLAVLNIPMTPVIDDAPDQFQTVPEFSEIVDNNGVQVLNSTSALMVQSRQIERDLRALPSRPSVVRAGTAVTIAELEDHIAAIDFTLNHPDLELSPEQEEIYWRERVRLMNSLLSLRTAQAQRMSF